MNTDSRRIFGLDLLRALAILFVVFGHGRYLIEQAVPTEGYGWFVLDGVTLFFVLSGYLIGRILLQTASREPLSLRTLLNFWLRRWFRTVPNYLLVLLLLLASFWLMGRRIEGNILSFFVFSQNLAWKHPGFFPEAWSLSVEEWFYLITPIPLFVLARHGQGNNGRQLLGWMLAAILAVILLRTGLELSQEVQPRLDLGLRKQVWTRLDSLMYGVIGACLSLNYPALWKAMARPGLLIGLTLILGNKILRTVLQEDTLYLDHAALIMAPLGTLLTLPFLSAWQATYRLIGTPIEFISRISYAMYLVNLSLVQWVIIPLATELGHHTGFGWPASPAQSYAAYWATTLLLSWMIHVLYERPMTNLRDRFAISASARRSGAA